MTAVSDGVETNAKRITFGEVYRWIVFLHTAALFI